MIELHFDEDRLQPAFHDVEADLGDAFDDTIDPFDHLEAPTGIHIRAKDPKTGRFKSADIYYLDSASMLAWLKSRGGNNRWAENVVGILLGYGALHTEDD